MRLRPQKDLIAEPQLLFMVGRLVGAAESAAILLREGKVAPEQLKPVGERLDIVAKWFIDSKPHLEPPPEGWEK